MVFSFKQALISLFELPPDESTLPEDHFIEVDDTPSYQPQYAQLTCAKNNADDPLASEWSYFLNIFRNFFNAFLV